MSRTTRQDRQDAHARSVAALNATARDRDHQDPARRLVGLVADALLRPEMSMGQQYDVIEQARAAAVDLTAAEPPLRRDVEDLLEQLEVQVHRTARTGPHWLVPDDLPTGGIAGLDAVCGHGHTLLAIEDDADEEAAA